MSEEKDSDIRKAIKSSARAGIVTFCTIFLIALVRLLVDGLLRDPRHVDWRLLLILCALGSGLVFLWTFVSVYFIFRRSRPALAVLEREPTLSLRSNEPMSGFVAMEYYGLILNRTFAIFVAPNALYGWKARGPVSSDHPGYYEPYQEMFSDQDLMRDIGAVSDLSKLEGGFVIQGSEIASIEASDKSKWGMGRIAHSGRIRIVLTNGKVREFILLGSVSPDVIRDKIVSIQTASPGSSGIVNANGSI